MTAFLVIAGQTIPVADGGAVRRRVRGGTSDRAYAGNLRSAVPWEKDEWAVTTGLMTDAEIATLRTNTALGAQVTVSGNAIGGSITAEVEVGDDAYISVATTDGLGFLHAMALIVRAV